MKPGMYETHSADETRSFGRTFAREVLEEGDTVLFYGDLGVGKTTCIKGIVEGLGGNPSDVVSPTFVLVNVYATRIPVYHIDLYRLQTYEDIFYAGIYDLFEKPGIRLIEWADRLGDFHVQRCIHVSMFFLNDDVRGIEWNFDSRMYDQYTNTAHTP